MVLNFIFKLKNITYNDFFPIEKSDLVSQTTEVKLKNNLSIVINCMLKRNNQQANYWREFKVIGLQFVRPNNENSLISNTVHSNNIKENWGAK